MPSDNHSTPFSIKGVFFLLVLLTLATFGSLFVRERFSESWNATTNTVFIMTVAAAKASLVILFFMHWKYEASWKFILCIPPIILAIITVLALMPDIGSDTYDRAKWNAPSSE